MPSLAGETFDYTVCKTIVLTLFGDFLKMFIWRQREKMVTFVSICTDVDETFA